MGGYSQPFAWLIIVSIAATGVFVSILEKGEVFSERDDDEQGHSLHKW